MLPTFLQHRCDPAGTRSWEAGGGGPSWHKPYQDDHLDLGFVMLYIVQFLFHYFPTSPASEAFPVFIIY